jgi:NAD-dependent histone deacetylase SIR2
LPSLLLPISQDNDKLLRNYTQNIDALEDVVGLDRAGGKILQCHGSFATATCLTCRARYTADDIREDVMAQRIARCEPCLARVDRDAEGDDLPWDSPTYGVIKPDITFFHEDLGDVFHECVERDRDVADLVVAMGSSLQVEPVCRVINEVDPCTPQILINRNIVGKS